MPLFFIKEFYTFWHSLYEFLTISLNFVAILQKLVETFYEIILVCYDTRFIIIFLQWGKDSLWVNIWTFCRPCNFLCIFSVKYLVTEEAIWHGAPSCMERSLRLKTSLYYIDLSIYTFYNV